LGFGLLQGCASGQCASLLSLGLLHRITVFSGDFAYNVRHYINNIYIYINGEKKAGKRRNQKSKKSIKRRK
jgi:hypothetical protein